MYTEAELYDLLYATGVDGKEYLGTASAGVALLRVVVSTRQPWIANTARRF